MVWLRVESGTVIYVSPSPLCHTIFLCHTVVLGVDGWKGCRLIVWLRVESGTVVYVSPSLPCHTIPHWIVDCGRLTLRTMLLEWHERGWVVGCVG